MFFFEHNVLLPNVCVLCSAVGSHCQPMKMENKKGYTEEYKEKSGGKEMKRTVREKMGGK